MQLAFTEAGHGFLLDDKELTIVDAERPKPTRVKLPTSLSPWGKRALVIGDKLVLGGEEWIAWLALEDLTAVGSAKTREVSFEARVSMVVSMPVQYGITSDRVLIAITISSSAALPARSPSPLMAHST